MADRNVRYGAEIRKLADAADKSRRARYPCPKCGKKSVKRISNSIWRCASCGGEFAGGAYSLSTPTGDVSSRQIGELRGRE
jgi:ribosomal protein eL43